MPSPTLTKAVFWSHTHDDDRDHDTGLFVEVRTADMQTLLAHLYNGEAGGQYGYADDENHWVNLQLDGNFTKEQCQGFHFRVGIQASSGAFPPGSININIGDFNLARIDTGNDRWRFDCGVTLGFSDGSEFPALKDDGCQIESKDSVLTWQGWV